jgi:hypothetical protein
MSIPDLMCPETDYATGFNQQNSPTEVGAQFLRHQLLRASVHEYRRATFMPLTLVRGWRRTFLSTEFIRRKIGGHGSCHAEKILQTVGQEPDPPNYS